MSERPIDLLFLGYASPRREAFFARHAGSLGRLNARLVFADLSEPRLASTPGYFAGERRATLLSSARIVLNVHATDVPYFETHRAHLALANGCAFVSESSTFVDPFVPGEHFVMAHLDVLIDAARDCLSRPDRLSAIAEAGAAFARSQASNGSGVYARAFRSIPAARSSRTTDDAHRRRDVVDRLREAKNRRRGGSVDWTESANAAAERQLSPSVSVVVTVHNYATFLAECLASVRASEPVPGGIEVVVVDDGSTDDSVAVARQQADAGDLAIRVVAKSTNTGLADARNLGLRVARGRYAFILDADNHVFPACLRTLHASITASGSAASYGIIQRFDGETGLPLGLLSLFAWNPRALVRGPYIDAMAMLDREVVLRLGGYSDDLVEHGWFGWEDYDLWLRICEAALAADLVPQVLSAYRVHPSSMIQQTNRWSRGVATHLATKFSGLVARFPGEDRYFGFPAADLGLEPVAEARYDAPDDLPREHVRHLERELAAVYASKSWRITAPLRIAFGLLRGERGRR